MHLAWLILLITPFCLAAAPEDSNPYAPPNYVETESAWVVRSADKLIVKLEEISRSEIPGQDKFRAAEEAIGRYAGWTWRGVLLGDGARTRTIPMEVSILEEALPVGMQESRRYNDGEDLRNLDNVIRQLDPKRLAGLDPHVVVPILALAKLSTLENFRKNIPAGEERSRWSQMVVFAEAHKSTMVLGGGSRLSLEGFFPALLGYAGVIVAVSGAMVKYGPGVLLESENAAYPAVSLSALYVYGAYVESRLRRRSKQNRKDAERQLKEVKEFSIKHKHAFSQSIENWGLHYQDPSKCFVELGRIDS